LYALDEATLHSKCRQFAGAFASRYPKARAVYASKTCIDPALARIFAEEGLGLDVVSGGELAASCGRPGQFSIGPTTRCYPASSGGGRVSKANNLPTRTPSAFANLRILLNDGLRAPRSMPER